MRIFLVTLLVAGFFMGLGQNKVAAQGTVKPSPEWVGELPPAYGARQMLVVAAVGKSEAVVSLHEKDAGGVWQEVMTTPGFIGKNGLGKTREGDAKTPVGIFHFTAAFGRKPDPGAKMPYLQVDENYYWSGDVRPGMQYNRLVDIRQLPNLNRAASEHLIEYEGFYEYCLNIGYNEAGTPGLGSAIFLHCTVPNRPFTGGCVAIPEDKMAFVLRRVDSDCLIVIDSLKELTSQSE
ncbi:MAG: hypothetical protein IJ849_03880 [Selenomonadaceae bacterium]|nr:hypothetical protein [Selenomonadaceae bacterium]